MADKEYRFWAYDLMTRAPLGQVPMNAVTCTTQLNTPGTFQGNLYPAMAIGLQGRESYSDILAAAGNNFPASVMQRLATATTPGRTIIVPEWNGVPLGAWKVEQRIYNSETQGQGAYWQINGSEILDHYNLRIYRGNTGGVSDAINSGLTPTPVGVDSITGTLQALLSYANDINLDLSGLVSSGVSDTESYDPKQRNTISTLIDNLVQQDVGPDIWIQCTWQSPGVRIPELKVIASSRIGVRYTDNPDRVVRIRYPYDIISYSITEDGTQNYVTVDELSQDQNGNTEIATASNPGLLTAGWPQTDFSFNRDGGVGQSITQATLQSWANADATLFNGPVNIGNYVVRPEAIIGLINPGDDIRVTITDYPMPFGRDIFQRTIGFTYDFDNRQVTVIIDGANGWEFSDTSTWTSVNTRN